MAKKSESKKAAWRCPLTGWDGAMDTAEPAGRVLRLQMWLERESAGLQANAAPFMGVLLKLLGDHEVTILAPRVDGTAWDSNLGWKQREGGFTVRLPLSRLADPRVADTVARHAPEDPIFMVERGRGETRTLVWSLAGGEFWVRTRFLPPAEPALVDELARRFFDLGGSETRVTLGMGELTDYTNEACWPPRRLGWSFESWLAESLEKDGSERGARAFGGPYWLTLLTTEHVEKMGGIARVETSLAELERVMARAREVAPWRVFPEPFDRAVRVRHGLLVRLAPADAVLSGECLQSPFARGHEEALAGARWLQHELQRGGLLALPRKGWLRDEERTIERSAREVAAREARSRDAKKKRSRRTKTAMAAPRCIRGVGRPESGDGQWTTFRILPGDLADEAMTIYGRKGNDSSSLVSPILVGSTKAERAALFFDAREHGWDGEHAPEAPAAARPLGRLTQFVCTECKGRLFRVWASFERGGEPSDVTELRAGRTVDDLFTWFSLEAECAGCGDRVVVADIECA